MTATEAPGRRRAGGVVTDAPPRVDTAPAVSRRRRALRPYLLAVPAVLLCVGILYPFFLAVAYTFFNFSDANPQPSFVGLRNYVEIFTSGSFWNSVRVTVLFAAVATTVETVLGVGVALLLNRSSLIGRIFERVLIVPLMVAPIIAAIMWKLLLLPEVGWVRPVLEAVGVTGYRGTDSPVWAFFWSVVVDAWIYTPFVAILALAGLRSLPASPFEAAAVDGAGWWLTFRRLTLPMLWPYVLVAVIFRLMDCLKVFDIIYGLTTGGPGDATTTLQINAYLEAISYARYSRGVTFMFILWIAVYLISMVLVRYLNRIQSRAAGV
ncbi:carbohydrate ABC transporter permease [Thermasporomyces composti]|jgi:multiple sugar transport system permease protein|uniref:Carbohydrate ABC transporter membrane protein 1 (CUT1 family) n=1 Tax=Thermasporomyces composti TaxID=696763 RepID=A0A3D9V5D1_THECX|nr:sugar ABC transporter permease [Thermasporomyces composti]REF36968.1 carbohydrate ABC transporter membrane protein 1 (CUT1 family) [Thermasporomyces composti]